MARRAGHHRHNCNGNEPDPVREVWTSQRLGEGQQRWCVANTRPNIDTVPQTAVRMTFNCSAFD